MHQRELEADAKKTIAAFNARIADLKNRIQVLETARDSYASAIINYTLDSARGPKERELILGSQECSNSPVGICVYQNGHNHCLFCKESHKS